MEAELHDCIPGYCVAEGLKFVLVRGKNRRLLHVALLALLGAFAACKTNPADPIVEPGPPALEPRAVVASAQPIYLDTATPQGTVSVSVSFENLDTSASGQVPLLGQARVQYLSGGLQEAIVALPDGIVATGADPGPFTAALVSGDVLAQTVAPGQQTVAEVLAAVSVQEYALVLDLFAEDSKKIATNIVSTDVAQPQVTALLVGSGAAGQTLTTVVTGSGFLGATKVVVDEPSFTAATPAVLDSGTLQVTLVISSQASAGSYPLRVYTPGGISPPNAGSLFSVIAPPAGPVILAQTLPAARQGSFYQARILATGGTTPLSFALVAGSLPAGLTLAAPTGEITGTPSAAGLSSFTAEVTDGAAQTVQASFDLLVNPIPSDGRLDLATPCDPWADAVAASNLADQADRATGSPDTVNALLLKPMSAAVAGAASSLTAPLTLVSDLDGSYAVFDMGATLCEQVVASAARTDDFFLNDSDGYIDSIYVWVSSNPTQLGRLVHAGARNAGTLSALPLGIDAGSDGAAFRYVTVAGNDVDVPNLDNLEILPEDTTPPETTLTYLEAVDGALLPKAGGDILHAYFLGDDTQSGANPAGTIQKFQYHVDDLTNAIPGTPQEAAALPGGTAEIFVPAAPDALYGVFVAATDAKGNVDASEASATYLIDTAPPLVSGFSAGGPSFRAPTGGTASIPLSGQAGDGGIGIGSVYVTVSGPAAMDPVTLSDMGGGTYAGTLDAGVSGSYTLDLYAGDAYGNTSAPDTALIAVSVNQPPTADAGLDQSVPEGSAVTLAASGITDPEGDPVTPAWTQIGGPQALLTGAGTAAPFFTAPAVPTSTPLTLTFRLTVSDNWNGSAANDVVVMVTNSNQPPVASAGPVQYVPSGRQITLDGTASSDPDQDTLTPSWILLGSSPLAPAITLTGAGTFQPTFTTPARQLGDPAEWIYTFHLTVDDGLGGTSQSTVDIHVTETNTAPVADAGPDHIVVDTNGVTLDGSASYDPDGDSLFYTWSLLSGDSAHITNWDLLSTSQAKLSIPAFQSGADETFVFQLQVQDGEPLFSTSLVQVDVRNYCVRTFSTIPRTQNAGEISHLAVDEANAWVYSLSSATGEVVRMDTGAGNALTNLSAPGALGASDFTLDPARSFLYWTNPATGSLVRLDALGGDTTSSLSFNTAPSQLALDSVSGDVFTLDRTGAGILGAVSSTFALRGEVPLGLSSAANAEAAFNPANGLVWVLSPADGKIVFVDPLVPALAGNLDLGPLALAGSVDGISIEAATGEVYLTHDKGVAILDAAGAVLGDIVLESGGGFAFEALAEDISGFVFASNKVVPGGPTAEHRLYRAERATGTAAVAVLGTWPGVDVQARIVHGAAGAYVGVLEGPSAGQSRLFWTPAAAPLAPASVLLPGGQAVAAAPGGALFYTAQRGRTLSWTDPAAAPGTASSKRIGFEARDIAFDPVSQGALLAGGTSQEARLAIPSAPDINVIAFESEDVTSQIVPGPQLFLLNTPRGTQPLPSFSVGRFGGVGLGVTPLGVPYSLPASGGRVDAVTDGTWIYLTDPAASAVRVLQAATGNLDRTIALPFPPRSLLLEAADGRLWAAGFGDGAVARILVGAGDTVTVISTLAGPSEMVANPVNGLLYLRCETADRVLAIDPVSATARAIVDAGPLTRENFGATQTRRTTLLADPVTGKVLALTGLSVAVIDPAAAHAVTTLGPLTATELLSMALLGGAERLLFVADGTRAVRIVNLADGFSTGRLLLPLTPGDTLYGLVAADPAGSAAFVAGTHTLSVIEHAAGACPSGGINYSLRSLQNGKRGRRYAIWEKVLNYGTRGRRLDAQAGENALAAGGFLQETCEPSRPEPGRRDRASPAAPVFHHEIMPAAKQAAGRAKGPTGPRES